MKHLIIYSAQYLHFFKFKLIFLFCFTCIFNWQNQNISEFSSSPIDWNDNLIHHIHTIDFDSMTSSLPANTVEDWLFIFTLIKLCPTSMHGGLNVRLQRIDRIVKSAVFSPGIKWQLYYTVNLSFLQSHLLRCSELYTTCLRPAYPPGSAATYFCIFYKKI